MTGGVVLATGIAVIAVIAFALFFAYMVSGKADGSVRGIAGWVVRHVPLQSVKIIIVAWQILTQVRV